MIPGTSVSQAVTLLNDSKRDVNAPIAPSHAPGECAATQADRPSWWYAEAI
jgi:hypothetical protein